MMMLRENIVRLFTALLTLFSARTVSANEKLFADFQKAFDVVDSTPEGHRQPFADDAVFEFCFRAEVDTPPACITGNYDETNMMFVNSIKTYKAKFNYVHGSANKSIHTFAAYLETKAGCKSFYTGSGWLEYNDEGKIVRQLSFSNDSVETMKCVLDYAADAAQQKK